MNEVLLIIVSHPDDEVLWFGAGIDELKNAGIKIVLLSLTNGSNHIRKAEFIMAANFFGVPAYMLDFPDGAGLRWDKTFIQKNIENFIERHEINVLGIITHSHFGEERKHPQHILSNEILNDYCRKKDIAFGFFSCHDLFGRELFRGVGNIFPSVFEFKNYSFSERLKYLAKQCKLIWRFKIVGGYARRDFIFDSSRRKCALSIYVSQHLGLSEYRWSNAEVHTLYADKKLKRLIK